MAMKDRVLALLRGHEAARIRFTVPSASVPVTINHVTFTTVANAIVAGKIGVAPFAAVAAFPAVSALFILPTYPTLLAAVQMDDTGTTQIGKAVFNHPFIVPGLINIAIAVALGFVFGSFIL